MANDANYELADKKITAAALRYGAVT